MLKMKRPTPGEEAISRCEGEEAISLCEGVEGFFGGLLRASATTLWPPATVSKVFVNSYIYPSCFCCLGVQGSDTLWRA